SQSHDTESDTEASELYNTGVDALRRRDIRVAIDNFERALKLDPKYRDAWLSLGVAHFAANEIDEGLEAVRKEISLYPDEVQAYKTLGFMFMDMRRYDEAAEAWRKLMTID